MTKNQIIKRAKEINNMLFSLQVKVARLTEELRNLNDTSNEASELLDTLEALEYFDLEDSIINYKEN